MKRKNLIFVSALLASQSMMAQTPYMNENYMPTDLIGSARYVGMGGALGALGADLSTASSNQRIDPARKTGFKCRHDPFVF